MSDDVNVKIGLEIHVPLQTQQKLFCACATNYYDDVEPNANTCPVCTGQPGSKPYPINERAVETSVMIARLLNCKVVYENIFVKRKHYNYPDLPSGYQRTSEPFGVEGKLNDVGIWEVHLEEDPGRYDLESGRVDYNRSGVPLIEIVSAPDMKSAQQARDFLKDILNLLKYTKRIVDVGGVLRADVNISIEGGAKVEIKNINSVRGAFKAVQYEIIRQKQLMKRGASVTQETRGFNEKSLITVSQRLKETAADYRYIPDPDIPPQEFAADFVDGIELPETPQRLKERLEADYNVKSNYAETLVRNKPLADAFLALAEEGVDSKLSSQWLCEEVTAQLNYRGIDFNESKLSIPLLVEWIELINEKTVTDTVAKKLLEKFIDSGESPKKIVESEGLGNLGDAKNKELDSKSRDVIKENESVVEDYIQGKGEALNYLIGQVMRKMKGRSDPKITIKKLKILIAESVFLRSLDHDIVNESDRKSYDDVMKSYNVDPQDELIDWHFESLVNVDVAKRLKALKRHSKQMKKNCQGR